MGACLGCPNKAKKYSEEEIGKIIAKSHHAIDCESENMEEMFCCCDEHGNKTMGISSPALNTAVMKSISLMFEKTKLKDG